MVRMMIENNKNLTLAEMTELYNNNREEYDRRYHNEKQKDFNKMTLAEQSELYKNNREEYDKKLKESQEVKCFRDLKVAEQMALYKNNRELYDYYSQNPNAPMCDLEQRIMANEQKKQDQIAFSQLDTQAQWQIKLEQERKEMMQELKELAKLKIELEHMRKNLEGK